jgi:hypothetical protein
MGEHSRNKKTKYWACKSYEGGNATGSVGSDAWNKI